MSSLVLGAGILISRVCWSRVNSVLFTRPFFLGVLLLSFFERLTSSQFPEDHTRENGHYVHCFWLRGKETFLDLQLWCGTLFHLAKKARQCKTFVLNFVYVFVQTCLFLGQYVYSFVFWGTRATFLYNIMHIY